jgi:hypothetical protein
MKSRIAKLSVSLIFLLAASAHNASAAETCDEADILYATTPAHRPLRTYGEHILSRCRRTFPQIWTSC